jgi:hypothetical protein
MVGIALLPFGGTRTNPVITGEARLDPHAREILNRACADCHSHRTDWPWYSAVAPVRWMLVSDVKAARAVMNFSEFDRPQPVLDAADMVRAREMPPTRYVALNPAARLTPAERDTLARGLEALGDGNGRTPVASPPPWFGFPGID